MEWLFLLLWERAVCLLLYNSVGTWIIANRCWNLPSEKILVVWNWEFDSVISWIWQQDTVIRVLVLQESQSVFMLTKK